ncbi:MAG TPA: 4-hydroxy-tetrahydrodipicolinate reductase [Burkholderiaceae bacterium]|nr:4-hydroxy-tetrahydrodipicolinate reductase [Burkholderiaceae bacterium]
MSAKAIRIAVAGSSGKMGRMLIETTLQSPDLQLVAALDRPDAPELGQDCAAFLGRASGVGIAADPAAVRGADVLIDFTRPAATLAHLSACTDAGVAMVIGTTGFDDAGRQAIQEAAAKIPIVFAPNMSVGVNATMRLVELAARILGAEYDVEILELHHRHKVDAPSGTALRMGELVAAARGVKLPDVAVYQREGVTGARREGTIGFAALRGGDVVGDHTVLFAADGERVEITHRSSSRVSYAHGSLRAARFVAGRTPGLYDMRDVLGSA